MNNLEIVQEASIGMEHGNRMVHLNKGSLDVFVQAPATDLPGYSVSVWKSGVLQFERKFQEPFAMARTYDLASKLLR